VWQVAEQYNYSTAGNGMHVATFNVMVSTTAATLKTPVQQLFCAAFALRKGTQASNLAALHTLLLLPATHPWRAQEVPAEAFDGGEPWNNDKETQDQLLISCA
jgi:hypothetical protein